jgi:predicted short-subunit dehydrogenase-like oxidoreductase (DUF2520 family)
MTEFSAAPAAQGGHHASAPQLRRRSRLTVGVIGAGRVGAVLGAALARAGHRVVAASGDSDASRLRRDALLPGVPLLPPDEVADGPELVVLAVPDDALPAVVDRLAAADAVRPGTIVVHPSGRYGATVLDPLGRAGALPLALHPAMTFAGGDDDLDRLTGAAFGVTAPDALRPVAEALIIEMGGEPVWVPEPARPLYHAALAGAANNLVTLTSVAADLLSQAGVDAPAGVLGPLLSAALDGALAQGDAALTGPVERGDAGTLREHLAVLAETAPQTVPAYVALARLTADRALEAGRLDPGAAGALLDVLAATQHRASTSPRGKEDG